MKNSELKTKTTKKLKIKIIIHSAKNNNGNLFPLPEGFLDKYGYYFGEIASDLYNKGILVFSKEEGQFVLSEEIMRCYKEKGAEGVMEVVEGLVKE